MIALLIDDDPTATELVAQLLRTAWKIEIEPLEIKTARTLQEGLALAPAANITILDIELPDSDAEQTIASIHLFRPPVIVLSGHTSDDPYGRDLSIRCIAAGAAHVFCKGLIKGLRALFFELMQKDILRRALEREAGGPDAVP